MIAVVLDDRCVACGVCVDICPTDVLEGAPGERPRIARIDDCQTCFACELYCPADAIYVDPDCAAPRVVTAADARSAPTLGQYRRHAGWGADAAENPNEFWRMGRMFDALAAAGRPAGPRRTEPA
jgi:NAD-dependent dihydropyrimidine dehydrogenase PreA subunit